MSLAINMTVFTTAAIVMAALDSDALTDKFLMKRRACANVRPSGNVNKDISGTQKLVTARVMLLLVVLGVQTDGL